MPGKFAWLARIRGTFQAFWIQRIGSFSHLLILAAKYVWMCQGFSLALFAVVEEESHHRICADSDRQGYLRKRSKLHDVSETNLTQLESSNLYLWTISYLIC